MKKLIWIGLLLLLVGCAAKPQCEVCEDKPPVFVTKEVNVTEYYCNTTNQTKSNISNTTAEYILNLIRQAKHCERYENFTVVDCMYDLEETEDDLKECNSTLTDLRGLLE